MRVGSLCTGYGGLEMGLRLASAESMVSWVAETAPELDVLYGPTPNLGDVARIDWSSVEPIDVLTAGFPCQPVSAAGRQRGDADARWLWPAVWAGIAELQPPQVFIENVRNLISMQDGRLWEGILDDLSRLGYGVRWLTLGACHVGAAHHRHRVFAVATLGGVGVERVPVSFCGAKGVAALPTPSASPAVGGRRDRAPGPDGRIHRPNGESHGISLDGAVQLLPTPQSRDGSSRGVLSQGNRKSPNLGTQLALLPTRDGQGRGTPSPGLAETRFASGRRNLDDGVALLPTPRATDGVNGGPGQRGRKGDLAMSSAVQPEHWGQFAEAVARHAERYGEPPAPTEPNRNGAPRLAPAFAEWLMCLPAGHVTSKLDRVPALRAIGNGVCPPQAATAWELLS